MRRKYALAGSALLLIMAMAGCVQGDDAGAQSTDGLDDVEPPSADEGQIKGSVVDDALAPVAGATVAILDLKPEVLTTTDEAGAFVLAKLAPGKYNLAVQKLGYESTAKVVSVAAGEVAEVQISLTPVPVYDEPYHQLLIGEGYFACGAYLIVTTWGNLHGCVWDDHKPRYNFEAPQDGLFGIMQELEWERNTGVTAEELVLYMQYKAVCDPFCDAEKTYTSEQGPSPIRLYTDDFEEEAKDFAEDPIPLSSVTFPGGRGPDPGDADPGTGPVVVFQQRMTHYITLFYWQHGDLETYSGLPEA
jgi:hypothetical protein